MKINNLFNEKKVVFSLEVFPPKPTTPIETVYKTLDGLTELKPDFISVTFGAGGSTKNNRTTEISSIIKTKYEIEPVAHLTCISSDKREIDEILEDLAANNIENILALRGDIPVDGTTKGDFNYASDLIKHIKGFGGFNVAAACYPEGHLDCGDLFQDIVNSKLKEEAGASHFISQLFFDNEDYYNFLNMSRKIGIKSPIQAGIMPVINKRQIERIVQMCGAKIPKKFLRILEKYENHPDALRDAGIAYATEQIIDLVSAGVDGIHLYTMNNPFVAKSINNNVSSIINTINNKE